MMHMLTMVMMLMLYLLWLVHCIAPDDDVCVVKSFSSHLSPLRSMVSLRALRNSAWCSGSTTAATTTVSTIAATTAAATTATTTTSSSTTAITSTIVYISVLQRCCDGMFGACLVIRRCEDAANVVINTGAYSVLH